MSSRISTWLTQEVFDKIFPYADCSAVYCPDNQPFWRLQDFLQAIDFLEKVSNVSLRGFASGGDASSVKLEVAAFLANFQQECGDGSLLAPYPWLWPKAAVQVGPEFGPAGGAVCIAEGLLPVIAPHKVNEVCPWSGPMSVTLKNNMRQVARNTIGLRSDDTLSCVVQNVKTSFQPQFGLGTGTGTGVILNQPGLAGVSDDGTLYGDNISLQQDSTAVPVKELSKASGRKAAAMGTYACYGGRGAIQLSYNYNYTYASLDLFSDYRLVRYPNLLITVDRETFSGQPSVFGFPGPMPNGANKLPLNVATSTPPARIMAWVSGLWFWMKRHQGKKVSCHEAMKLYTQYGITACNVIVNNQSGLTAGTWAAKKIEYYKRVCAILGISSDNTIVTPASVLA